MAWDTELVQILRVLVNDLADTPAYSDDRLKLVLLVAARQVQSEVVLPAAYTTDLQALTLTPDPTDPTTVNESAANLFCLKAACILDRGETRAAAGQAIAVRDGSSSIDLRSALGGRLELLKVSWCAAYDRARLEYAAGQSGSVAGAAVIGPFRFWARGANPYPGPLPVERAYPPDQPLLPF
jgi:hypothetical protein